MNNIRSVKEALLTNKDLSLYITQTDNPSDAKHLIIENVIFQPFSFKVTGLSGKLDEKRTRYSFECHFRDLQKNSEGKVQALIVFDERHEGYFETLTVFLEKPTE